MSGENPADLADVVGETHAYPPHQKVNKQAFLLKSALEATGMLSVIQCETTETQAKAICRVAISATEAWEGAGGLIHYLLQNEGSWSSHICKCYVLRGREGEDKQTARLAYCWIISIAAAQVEKVLPLFIALIQAYRKPVAQQAAVTSASSPLAQKKGPGIVRKFDPELGIDYEEMRLVGVSGEELNPTKEKGGNARLSDGKPPFAKRSR